MKNTYESAMASKLQDSGDDPNRNTLYMPSDYEDSDDVDEEDNKCMTTKNPVGTRSVGAKEDQRDDNQRREEVDDRAPSSPQFMLQRCLAWSQDEEEFRDTAKVSDHAQRHHHQLLHENTYKANTQSLLQPICQGFNEHHVTYQTNTHKRSGSLQYLAARDVLSEDGWAQLARSRIPVRQINRSYDEYDDNNDDDDQMMWVISTPSTETISGLQLVKSYGSFHSAIIDSVNSCDFHGDHVTTTLPTMTMAMKTTTAPASSSPVSSSSSLPPLQHHIRPVHWETQVTADKKLDSFFLDQR
jgi:hypothetical protein